jgi:glutamine amidotransferase PdxT
VESGKTRAVAERKDEQEKYSELHVETHAYGEQFESFERKIVVEG